MAIPDQLASRHFSLAVDDGDRMQQIAISVGALLDVAREYLAMRAKLGGGT